MRKMEKEAYLKGNMCFRDWEDTIQNKDKFLIKLAESKFLKENKTMTTKITKDFLREAIKKVLQEEVGIDALSKVKPGGMSDEDYYEYAQRNTALKDTPRYKKIEGEKLAAKQGKPDFRKDVEDAAAKARAAHKKSGDKTNLAGKGVASLVREEEQLCEGPIGAFCSLTAGKLDGLICKTTKEEEARTGKKTKCVSFEEADKLNLKTGEPKAVEEGLLNEQPGGALCTPEGGELFGGSYESDPKTGKMICVPFDENEPLPSHILQQRKKDQKKKELEEKLGDGETQGSDSVDAKLDKNPKFTRADLAAEKGGKRGKSANESKIQTPEQENTLYEQRFSAKNNRLFEKLVKEWTK